MSETSTRSRTYTNLGIPREKSSSPYLAIPSKLITAAARSRPLTNHRGPLSDSIDLANLRSDADRIGLVVGGTALAGGLVDYGLGRAGNSAIDHGIRPAVGRGTAQSGLQEAGVDPQLAEILDEYDRLGVEIRTSADPEVAAIIADAERRSGTAEGAIQAITYGDIVLVRSGFEEDFVTLSEELIHVKQQLGGHAAVGASGFDTRTQLEIEAREELLRSPHLSPDEREMIVVEIETISDRGSY